MFILGTLVLLNLMISHFLFHDLLLIMFLYLDQIMTSTNAHGATIKKTLDEIKKQNIEYSREHKNSAKAQMRNNLYQTHIRKFHSVMNDYNSAAHGFKQDLQARTRREIKIVNSNISDDEVDKIIESGKANVSITIVTFHSSLSLSSLMFICVFPGLFLFFAI